MSYNLPKLPMSYTSQAQANKLYELIREIVRDEINNSLERMKG